ncbi:MAG: VCBS repeat-containing protein [Deltaproteobacteria bacterium]|nr:VCBS repeat-containing protein [Deltaproteobacteria bacterium]MBI3386168.1 VCBS repeat-containing protein [Deltaproteobacteria bacterium]
MFNARQSLLLITAIVFSLLVSRAGSASTLTVVSMSPTRLASAAKNTAVTITFDQALLPSTITASSFRVFGKQSGVASGPFTFSNANQSVTLTPGRPFAAGEVVIVNLSHTITAADSSPLRSAGFAYQFRIQTQPSSRTFTQIQQMSNRTNPSVHTQIYGAMAADLNGDGYVDLTTVNEDSADLRVFVNRADGSGQFGGVLTPPFHIGIESSPNESGDFNGDGVVDIVISATTSNSVWLVRGKGDGGWASSQSRPVGMEPHGIAALDVDGDGDWDVVNANHTSNNLSLMINNGGMLSAPTFFDSGEDGEYALTSGDMNNDGISDLIVGAQDGQTIVVLLGNGSGTFTAQTPQSAGGLAWKLTVGDVNGDGKLDVATANGDSGNAAILLGNGDGTLQAPTVLTTAPHVVGSALGDLDGDGDLDWVVSSYGGGLWHILINDGAGNFTFDPDIPAISNPSCAILLDIDNDGDLDLALTDEIADIVKIMQNDSGPPPACPPVPDTCRGPAVSGKGLLLLIDRSPDTSDLFLWQWLKGTATPKADFGDPLTTDTYFLCLYDNNTLVSDAAVPAGNTCGAKPCWKDNPTNFAYSNPKRTPAGVLSLHLNEGLADGQASITLLGRGANLGMPDVSALTGPIDVQLRKSSGGICWGAHYSAPFLKHQGGLLLDRPD